MNNPQHLDELFQSAAENFRPEVSPIAWQEIEARIKKNRRKGFGWFWWTSAAVLVLFGGGLSFWIQNNKTAVNQYNANHSHQIKKYRSLGANNFNKKNEDQDNIPEEVHYNKNDKRHSLISNQHQSEEISDKLKMEGSNVEPSPIKIATNRIKKAQLVGSIATHLQDKKERQSQYNKPKGSIYSRNNNDLKTAFNALASDIEATQKDVDYKDIFLELLPLKTKNAPQLTAFWGRNLSFKKDQPSSKKDPNPKKQKSEIKRPQYAVSINPEYVNNWENLRPSYRSSINGTAVFIPVDSSFQNSLNTLSHYVGWSAAAQSRFILGNKTTFDVSLSYTNRGDHQNYFDCFNPNTGETKKNFQPIAGWQCSEATYNNRYHFVALPLGFTHALTGDITSSGFRVQWNFIPTYLAGGYSMTYSFAQQDFLTNPVRTNPIYQKFGLNVGAGLVYAFKVGPKQIIETGLNWNGSWTTLFNDQYPVNKKFGATGAKIALIIK